MPSLLVTARCGWVMSLIVHAGHADRTQEAFQLHFFFSTNLHLVQSVQLSTKAASLLCRFFSALYSPISCV